MSNTDTSALRQQLATRAEPADLTPHGSYLPAPNEWSTISQMAIVLAKSTLVPTQYRQKPENIILATMAGRPFGWDPTMSMRSFHVIEGVPSLKPEILLALVRAAGHSVTGEATPEGATITGTRRDNGDSVTCTFTLEQAKVAGLAGKDVWRKYPEHMCWARCVSAICRRLFGDVTLGVSYTPDELEEAIDAGVIDVEGPDPRVVELKDRARALPDDLRDEFAQWFDVAEMTYRNPVHLASIQAKLNELEEKAADIPGWLPSDDDVVDAELVDEPPRQGDDKVLHRRPADPPPAAPRVDDARGASPVDGPKPTATQNRKLFACLNVAGILGDDDRHEYASATLGRDIKSFTELNRVDAGLLIDRLEALPVTNDLREDVIAGLRDGGILGPQRFSWSGKRIGRSIKSFDDLTCGEASKILAALAEERSPDGGDAA